MPSKFPGCAVFAVVGADEAQGKKGTPIFVIGGLGDDPAGNGPAMMITSKNGIDWLPQTFRPSAEIYMLTWNESEQALFAGMMDYPDNEDTITIVDVALRSFDGLSWEEVGEVADPTREGERAIEPFCSNKVTDLYGRKVPTSIFGYDKDKDILITPHPLDLTFGLTYPVVLGRRFSMGVN